MYYYLNGFLALLEPDRAVVDCGGVGYLVSITRKTYDSLAAGGAFNASGHTVGNNVTLVIKKQKKKASCLMLIFPFLFRCATGTF